MKYKMIDFLILKYLFSNRNYLNIYIYFFLKGKNELFLFSRGLFLNHLFFVKQYINDYNILNLTNHILIISNFHHMKEKEHIYYYVLYLECIINHVVTIIY